jgi:hypothetical protein
MVRVKKGLVAAWHKTKYTLFFTDISSVNTPINYIVHLLVIELIKYHFPSVRPRNIGNIQDPPLFDYRSEPRSLAAAPPLCARRCGVHDVCALDASLELSEITSRVDTAASGVVLLLGS